MKVTLLATVISIYSITSEMDMEPTKEVMPTYKIGLDGNWYLVFCDSYQLELYGPVTWQHYGIACFDQYENAYQLTNWPVY
jgi:hypothetical protein